MTLLLLLSFPTHLSQKVGTTSPRRESKYWENTPVVLDETLEFDVPNLSETNWKFGEREGYYAFPPASTSPTLTHIHNSDVVYYAAKMQAQNAERDDRNQETANEHNLVVIKDIIDDAMKYPTLCIELQNAT